jgi:hypothetical protein
VIHGIGCVGMLTTDTTRTAERLGLLGLIPTTGPVRLEHLDVTCSVFSTRSGGVATIEPAPGTRLAASAESRPGLVGVLLCGDQDDVDRMLAAPEGRPATGVFGAMAIARTEAVGTTIELAAVPIPSAPDSSLARIESIPWAAADAGKAAAALEALTGLAASEEWSGLEFPDLGTRNRLVFAGPHGYVDFNEPTRPGVPIHKLVERQGSGIYAVVLEPVDFDGYVEGLEAAGVPTVTPQPIDLRVRWKDGTEGSAARIVMVDRAYVDGARIFVSSPTFPW